MTQQTSRNEYYQDACFTDRLAKLGAEVRTGEKSASQASMELQGYAGYSLEEADKQIQRFFQVGRGEPLPINIFADEGAGQASVKSFALDADGNENEAIKEIAKDFRAGNLALTDAADKLVEEHHFSITKAYDQVYAWKDIPIPLPVSGTSAANDSPTQAAASGLTVKNAVAHNTAYAQVSKKLADTIERLKEQNKALVGNWTKLLGMALDKLTPAERKLYMTGPVGKATG